MDQLFTAVRWVHIAPGLLGLAIFWLPLVLKKGGTGHRRVGWVFVVCMSIASITAAILAALRLVRAVQNGKPLTFESVSGPLFLINVAALTFVSVYHGVQVLRQKKRTEPLAINGPNVLTLGLPAALFAISLATVAVGVRIGAPVLFTLPVVGFFVSSQQLWCLLRAPTSRMFWWLQHMAGMMGGCIAAITAALITNAAYVRKIVPLPEWALWIAPAAIGIPLLIVWQRHYSRKFHPKTQPGKP